MPYPTRTSHLVLSSPHDALPVGETASKQFRAVESLACWGLGVDRPSLLLRGDLSAPECADYYPLCEKYRAVLGEVSFGLWADVSTPHLTVESYVRLARKLLNVTEAMGCDPPTLLLTTARADAFRPRDMSLPVGVGVLREALPAESRLSLICPPSASYRALAEESGVTVIPDGGRAVLVTGPSALRVRPAPAAQEVFLAPWWEAP